MTQMNPRERILSAFSCKPTDIVPFDLGGTKATTLNARAYEKLKAYLGVTSYTELGHYRGKMVRLAEEVSQFFAGGSAVFANTDPAYSIDAWR